MNVYRQKSKEGQNMDSDRYSQTARSGTNKDHFTTVPLKIGGEGGLRLALIVGFWIIAGCSLRGMRRAQVKPDIDIIIAPRTASYHQDRAALVFFAPFSNSQTMAAECTTIFQKAFLKHKVFKIIEPCSAPGEPEEYLMDIAREKGFDILVHGKLSDFYLALGEEKGRAAVSLKVFDLKTRVTLWYIDCAVQEAGRAQEDWIVFKRAQLDSPPPHVLLAHIAEEAARTIAMRRPGGI